MNYFMVLNIYSNFCCPFLCLKVKQNRALLHYFLK